MVIVTLQRDKCIGCNYCVEMAPEQFQMSKKDGKTVLLRSTEKKAFSPSNHMMIASLRLVKMPKKLALSRLSLPRKSEHIYTTSATTKVLPPTYTKSVTLASCCALVSASLTEENTTPSMPYSRAFSCSTVASKPLSICGLQK